MTEWKEHTGSDEQLRDIVNCKTDVLCRYKNGTERFKSEMFVGDWRHKELTHYLLCNPHPLADMICQQARTGQPVWLRIPGRGRLNNIPKFHEFVGSNWQSGHSFYKTTKPDWYIPGAEYCFTPFGEEV